MERIAFLVPAPGQGKSGFRPLMGVQYEPFVRVIVRNWCAVEIDVVVGVRALGEVVVVQWAQYG